MHRSQVMHNFVFFDTIYGGGHFHYKSQHMGQRGDPGQKRFIGGRIGTSDCWTDLGASLGGLRNTSLKAQSERPLLGSGVNVWKWAKQQRGSILLRVRFLRTSGLIGERVTKILSGPGSLRGHQLNFPIALAEAIPLNVWKLGLAPVSRQYRTKSSAPTSIKITSHPLLCQFAISLAWRKSHFSYESAG